MCVIFIGVDMVFRRIIFNAIIVGALAGLLLSVLQIIAVNPIIFAAETFEVAEHDHGSHDHSEEAWAPADGGERTFYTVLSNILAGVGFAAVILALMSQFQMQGLTRLNLVKGALWGAAGFVAFFVAPGIGLPPEIPGIEAAPVEHRQTWWALAVFGVGAGLMVLAFAPVKFKALGAVLIALPYLVSAPHLEGPAFTHPDPAAVEALTALHEKFIMMSGISNLVFWLVLGLVSAWVLNRWVLKGFDQYADGNA